ncbi:MAG: hypothetical protein HS119_11380 [Flavobacteriales bacterium]|nr:hypothetical protein [Flavobacteriales bacterium]
METIIRNIGNSKGIIIPQAFLKKYRFFERVNISESSQGIIITPVESKSLFEIKLDELRANKDKVYALMRKQASDPETIAYYEQQAKELGDIDIEILED